MCESFYTSKKLIENIFGLKIILLSNADDYEFFCKNHIAEQIFPCYCE